MIKRTVDILASAVGLALLSPLLLLIALLVKFGSPGPVLFRQRRIGRHGRPFWILKIRTMIPDAASRGTAITIGEDPRITTVGRLLRRMKLDELPQLFNVLIGDMSLVGPRPEVPRYVELFPAQFEEILRVRPGITDLASIKFRDEAAILGKADDPEREYVQRILPEKIQLARQYVQRCSLWLDVSIIWNTIMVVFRDSLLSRRQS